MTKRRKLFVGQIPHDFTEASLHTLFSQFGTVEELNLVRDPVSLQSKGCAFISLDSIASCESAIEKLHNVVTLPRSRKPLCVRLAHLPPEADSFANTWKLYVAMLPKETTEEGLRALFSAYGEVVDTHIMRDLDGHSKGCGFVRFSTYEEAHLAVVSLNNVHKEPGSSIPVQVRFAHTREEKQMLASPLLKMLSLRGVCDHASLEQYYPAAGYQLPSRREAPYALNTVSAQMAIGVDGGVYPLPSHVGAPVPGLPRPSPGYYSQMAYPNGYAYAPHPYHAHAHAYPCPTAYSGKEQALMSRAMSHISSAATPRTNATAIEHQSAAADDTEKGVSVSPTRPSPSPARVSARADVIEQMPVHPVPTQQKPSHSPSPTPPITPNSRVSGSAVGVSSDSLPALHTPHNVSPMVTHIPMLPHMMYHAPPFFQNSAVRGPVGANLFVYGIPESFSDYELYGLFAPFGHVLSVAVPRHRGAFNGKGYGFVSYSLVASAQHAVQELNGIIIGGKAISVSAKKESGDQMDQSQLLNSARANGIFAPPPENAQSTSLHVDDTEHTNVTANQEGESGARRGPRTRRRKNHRVERPDTALSTGSVETAKIIYGPGNASGRNPAKVSNENNEREKSVDTV